MRNDVAKFYDTLAKSINIKLLSVSSRMKRASLAKSWRGNKYRPKKDLRHFLPIN